MNSIQLIFLNVMRGNLLFRLNKSSLTLIYFLMLFFVGGNAYAACSSYQGRVVINEYNYIDNWIELKVLDSSAISASTQFAGWKLWVFEQNKPGSPASQNVGSMYTNAADNTCGAASTQYYIRIPFQPADMGNDVNVVLADASNNIVDILRIDQSALATYYSGFNSCSVTLNNLTDAPITGSSGNKDIARLPDGTGPWVISNGTGNNSQQSLCGSNDTLFQLTKTPSSTSVGIGSSNPFVWTINVKNGGTTGSLSSTNVTDTLPSNMFLSACPASATCTGSAGAYTGFSRNVGTLAPGASATISATAYVTSAGTYTNTARADATELAPGYTLASSTVTTSTCAPPYNIPSGVTVTCQCDNFTRTNLNPSTIFGGNWVATTSDTTGIVPRIVNSGYMRMTENTGNNAKAATVPGIFPAAGNYISVEFRQYAYNGSNPGADGIAVTLSDYAVPAQPGAFGGSLGYAQRTGVNGFAGGWIGVALDEYGNYQNPTEGRDGGPGFIVQSVGVRGSGSGVTGYPWLKGAANLTTVAPNVGIDNRASTTPSLGDYFQVIVDSRNNNGVSGPAYVSVNRDISGLGNAYSPLIASFDAFAAATAIGRTQAPVPQNWQVSFTGSTGGSNNIHEIGSLRICAQNMVPTTGGTPSGFNAIDEVYTRSDVNAVSGHLYTKLAGTAFTVKVAALNTTGSGILTTYAAATNKTVTVKLIDNSTGTSCNATAAACSACSKPVVATQNMTFASTDTGFKQSANFTVPAYANLLVQMSDGTTTGCSVDTFAVRPLGIASVVSSNATNTTSTGIPIFKAGSTNFALTATTTGITTAIAGNPSGYTGGIPKINAASVQASSPATVAGVLAGSFAAATSGTSSATATGSTFIYDEVGAFYFQGPDFTLATPRIPGVYDDTWSAVDSGAKNDCIAGNTAAAYSNSKDLSGTFTTNTNYGKYGCNFGISASTGAFGRFVPDHFNTIVTQVAGVPMACPDSSCPATYNGIVYSGQSFSLTVTAKNASEVTTSNYNTTTGFAKTTALSAFGVLGTATVPTGAGTLGVASVSAFAAGTLTELAQKYTFTTLPTAPTNIYIRAVDTDGVTSLRGVSSVEGGVQVVSGRIKVSNAYGSELLPLTLTATAQYYGASGWVNSSTDNVTNLTLLGTYDVIKNGVTTGTTAASKSPASGLSAGILTINLAKPTGGATGIATINPTAPGYLPVIPGTATFGVYKGNNNFIYQRENY